MEQRSVWMAVTVTDDSITAHFSLNSSAASSPLSKPVPLSHWQPQEHPCWNKLNRVTSSLKALSGLIVLWTNTMQSPALLFTLPCQVTSLNLGDHKNTLDSPFHSWVSLPLPRNQRCPSSAKLLLVPQVSACMSPIPWSFLGFSHVGFPRPYSCFALRITIGIAPHRCLIYQEYSGSDLEWRVIYKNFQQHYDVPLHSSVCHMKASRGWGHIQLHIPSIKHYADM